MSALGQKQTFAVQNSMSALHPIADMCSALAHVCFVPKADMAAKLLSLDLLDVRQHPRFVEERFFRTVKAEQ